MVASEAGIGQGKDMSASRDVTKCHGDTEILRSKHDEKKTVSKAVKIGMNVFRTWNGRLR